MKRQRSAIQWVAALVPALAALPSAYFVGRSTYYHLILGWFGQHVEFWPWLGAAVAVVAGLVVEGLGTVSLFLWSAFRRWNEAKATRDDGTLKRGYDLAPERLALVAFAGYAVAVTVLLLVLEAWPGLAAFAPLVFPALTAVGGLCWSLYDQHRDRLAYHGLTWSYETSDRAAEERKRKRERRKAERKQAGTVSAPLSIEVLERDDWACYYCGKDVRETDRRVDRFIPGGDGTANNLVTSCTDCSQMKRDKEPDEMMKRDFGLYLKAKSGGRTKKNQILALAQDNGHLTQADIARILRTSQGYVSTTIGDKA